MGEITSRAQLKQYVLRKLGEPVINVNIADEQLEDAINDAILYFQEYHFEGCERTYIARKVTAEDKTNKWIPTPSYVRSVTKVFKPYDTAFGTSIGQSLFDIQYQFFRNEIFELTRSGAQLSNFHIVLQYIAEMNDMLNFNMRFRFQSSQSKLHIDTDWNRFMVDTYLVYEAFEKIDPEDATHLYDHFVLKKLAVLEAKIQWGMNMRKFNGVQLPGGVVMNGEAIYQGAMQEMDAFKENFQTNFQEPLELFIS